MTATPRWARRILRASVPADVRDAVDGDLEESYRERVATRGRASAAVWYWKETASFTARFFIDRARRTFSAGPSLRQWFSSVDIRLGARLLAKHPGLTLTAGFGIAAAIGITAGFFAFVTAQLHPRIPFENGDRFVSVEYKNMATNRPDRHVARDFLAWRDDVTSVDELSAFRNITAGLETGPAAEENITIAGMTASGFRLAGVPALLGRYLTPDDERPGAPLVMVVGYDEWRGRFSSDPAIVGRQLRINDTLFTVVGVMPAGFSFPLRHQYWSTLLMDPATIERGKGPEIYVFGRLAPGATMQSADAELASIGRRSAALFPETNASLRLEVLPYVFPFIGLQDPEDGSDIWRFQFTTTLIVLVVALNVAILVYARTAVRRTELAVRTALGASRRRIVGQLFVEALALSLPPAVCGLAIAQYGLRLGGELLSRSTAALGDRAPFWTDYSLRPQTALYVLGLAVLIAVIVGVLPGLQATGRHIESDLRKIGGGKGRRLGTIWTSLVVAQVAFAVAVLPPAVENGVGAARQAFTRPSYPAANFASGWLTVKRAAGPSRDKTPPFGARLGDLVRTLRSDPSVVGVTFQSAPPTGTQWSGRTEIEGVTLPKDVAWTPRARAVDPEYFDVYSTPVLQGRRFTSSDAADSAHAVIVNRSFVHRLLGDRPALGHRLRYVPATEDPSSAPVWFEIVGVVEDLQHNDLDADLVAPQIFHPFDPGQLSGVSMIVRTASAVPATLGASVHDAVAATDPELRLGTLQTGETVGAESSTVMQIVGMMLLLIVGTGLLLSAAGVYAVMSFTVAQRRREIGIRRALGATQAQVMSKVFAKAALQIGSGVTAGAAVAVLLIYFMEADAAIPLIVLVPIVALVMTVISLGATLVPTRRGLAIEPVETLRSE